ncbi:hypothetical protein QN277_008006 [Acacia crassicarpa]|uniref:RING-type E3 ubiquitin transferase n=1 Tax=Acacia crassicarpa TaxID=499986 RepID=A0AAE1MCN5_9FABA|nr:hypothetical protein QN277_008006 [Acacia crassicarpa]
MILNSPQMSHFLMWLMLVVFVMATSLRMYVTWQQLQAQARAHATAAELQLHVPPSIAIATRGRLQGLRLQLALLDREFDELDNETLRALESATAPGTTSMTDEEINTLPVHTYRVPVPRKDGSAGPGMASSSHATEVIPLSPVFLFVNLVDSYNFFGATKVVIIGNDDVITHFYSWLQALFTLAILLLNDFSVRQDKQFFLLFESRNWTYDIFQL